MKKLFLFLSVLSIVTTLFIAQEEPVNTADETQSIDTMLNSWHVAAGKSDYKNYFDKIAEDGIYIGTDATENWNKKDFAIWAKPYFDKGKAWNFTPLERHIFFSKDGKTAWFDELLNTQMKICRGSGVVEKQGKEWKIKHYVLSMTVPNDVADQVIPLKAKHEDAFIEKKQKTKY